RQCEQRPGAHRVDVAERVRGGDRTEVRGTGDERREEVEREDERLVIVELVYGRVVGRVESDEQGRIVEERQRREKFLKPARRVLRGAASANGCLEGGGHVEVIAAAAERKPNGAPRLAIG